MPVHQSVISAHATLSAAPMLTCAGTSSPNTQPSPTAPAGT